jgi:hypothetical protein
VLAWAHEEDKKLEESKYWIFGLTSQSQLYSNLFYLGLQARNITTNRLPKNFKI